MRIFKSRLISIFLLLLCSLPAQQVRAELIASSDNLSITYLLPLQNGRSALTLVWSIGHQTAGRVAALKAGLSSVVLGGTNSRSAFEINDFLRQKGIKRDITTNGQNLVLTITAPNDVFPETLVLLGNLLLETEYSKGWYARELEALKLTNSSRTRRPSEVLNEIAHFLKHDAEDADTLTKGHVFQFGRPSQAILRSGDENVERRTQRILKKLPKAEIEWELPFAKWASALFGIAKQPFTLPTGVIHFEDLDSTEMLILFVKAEAFEDEGKQLGANLLVDYIGINQGSEMFRIIRQEMRAAYDPRSEFRVMNKNRALISFSATVEAKKWPEVYDRIASIYKDVHAGKIDEAGLMLQYGALKRRYDYKFFNDPVWGMRQFLNEYPNGTKGTIRIPLFEAFEVVDFDTITTSSDAYLPLLEGYLLVLIGGGLAPNSKLKAKGYCSLPKNTSLNYCLDELQKSRP